MNNKYYNMNFVFLYFNNFTHKLLFTYIIFNNQIKKN